MQYREYLSSPSMLKYIDAFTTRTQYVRVVVLNWQGLPIANIEGRAQGGSISINNSSPIRRTGSVTLVTELNSQATDLEIMHEVTNMKTLISMNKKVEIEVGIKNNGNQYLDYDIFWFPLGEYYLSNASVTWNNTGITVSLKLNDNMASLNGEIGGTIPASVDLARTEKDGEPVFVYDIVYALARMGGIPPSKIVIEDIPRQIAGIVKMKKSKEVNGQQKNVGDIIGTTLTNFYWPNESLSVSAGSTIAQALETIKQKLGNFEYFFDLNGVFHFRKIKNYLEEGSTLQDLTEAINEKYFTNTARGKSTYSFLDSELISVYSNNPQYNEIKNDFHVWGETPDTKMKLHYHLIIDDTIPNKFEKNWWTVKKNDNGEIINAMNYESKEEAEKNGGVEYVLEAEKINIENDKIIPEIADVIIDNGSKLVLPALESFDNRFYFEGEDQSNWRQKMYLEAIGADEPTIFQSEILGNLSSMMDTTTSKYIPKPSSLYFLDAINTNDAALMNNVPVKDFAISAIGDRVKVINDNKIDCLFEKIKTEAWIGDKLNLENLGLTEEYVSIGIVANPAYDALRSSIHNHLSYNNNITLTAMPIYHLDVNQRISVNNNESDIHGDYIIQSLTIPLDLGGMMTINARKAIEMI